MCVYVTEREENVIDGGKTRGKNRTNNCAGLAWLEHETCRFASDLTVESLGLCGGPS